MGTDPPARPLAVTGATLDGETVGLRCEDGAIAAIGPDVVAQAGDETIGDLASDLVYAASGSVVDTTVVGGRVLMRGGVVEGAAEIVARARERTARLGIGSI